MCTLWSSADNGFSTNGLWNTSPFTSIVSFVSWSSSGGGRRGRGEGGGKRREEKGRRER